VLGCFHSSRVAGLHSTDGFFTKEGGYANDDLRRLWQVDQAPIPALFYNVEMTPSLETRRLLLRPLELADAPQAQLLFPQWEIVRYLTNQVPWPYPPDGACKYYRDVALPAMERGEQWHWTLRLRELPEQMIGSIGLLRSPDTNRGFWLGLPWQGQGLMTEAAEAVTDYWFDVLKFPVLRVPKAVDNLASRRISEKHRMRVVATETRHYVSGPALSEIWEITAEEWRAQRAGQSAGS
jgi:RimJ/RimL family protein N-acetyltransferase